MKRIRSVGAALALATIGLGIAACADSTGPDGDARIRVQLTDAPSDMIAKAEVWISRVYMMPDEDGEQFDLFNDAASPKSYDLLLLRDGVTADLTAATDVDPGEYRQLRIVVDSAFITLAEGYSFNDGSTTASLKVPSGAQTGIKVQLSEPIAAESGETTTVLVDFDVDQNFVIQGNPNTPAGINGILFTPVLHEKSRSTTEES